MTKFLDTTIYKGNAIAHPPIWLTLVTLVFSTFLAYLPAINAEFIWDDDDYVTENQTLRNSEGLFRIWFDTKATPQYYPAVHTTFWIEYQIWGLHPRGYHINNIALHAANATMLLLLLRRLQVPGGWLCAFVFALHPVNVESVAWVTERKNVLSGLFYLLAFHAYWTFQTRRELAQRSAWGWYALAFISFICALLSKSVTCTLPAAILLVIYWQRGRLTVRDVLPTVPIFVAGIAYGLITVQLERDQVGARGPEFAWTFMERCQMAGWAIWHYARTIIWPVNLMFFYPQIQLNRSINWLWVVSAVAVPVIAGLGIKRWGRAPLVAMLFFGGTLFPALGFINVYPFRYSLVADHFQYLASIGLMVLVVSTSVVLLFPLQKSASLISADGLRVRQLLFRFFPYGALLGILGTLSWQQCGQYHDVETLWRTTLQKHPKSYPAHNHLAHIELQRGNLSKARQHWVASLTEKPSYNSEAEYNLLILEGEELLAVNDAAGALDKFRSAMRVIQLAEGRLELDGQVTMSSARATYDAGKALLALGRPVEAEAVIRDSLQREPNAAGTYSILATAFERQGKYAAALQALSVTLKLQPNRGNDLRRIAFYLAAIPDARLRNAPVALSLTQQLLGSITQPDFVLLDVHAVALAANGRFDEAADVAAEAAAVAKQSAQNELADEIGTRLSLYRQNKPYSLPLEE